MNKLNLKDTYSNWVNRQGSARGITEDQAMANAVGAQFEAFGIIEKEMLRFYGLTENGYLIDVGCGSGRLAIPLSSWLKGRYLGTDIVPELVSFASAQCRRSDWRFQAVETLSIPESGNVADMVCFFSVLTHLLHEQSYIYLEEAYRVLKPGGRAIFSFLEFSMPSHWCVFANTVEDARGRNEAPLNVFISREAVAIWAEHLGFSIVDIRSGDEPFVPLANPLRLDDGRIVEGFGNLGQSICVLQKPFP